MRARGRRGGDVERRPAGEGDEGGAVEAVTEAEVLSVDAPGEANNGDDAAKRRERAHSLKELLATERVYRDQLACVVERLPRPLAWACAGGALR